MDEKLSKAIKKLCFDAYDKKLTKNGKCKTGVEWTVFSAIVMKKQNNENNSKDLRVVSMGTGTKCIGQELIDRNGCMVHDSHAEVIARRSFLCYLYDNIEKCLRGEESILEIDKQGCVVVPSRTEFYMFSTSAPCGDACIMNKNNVVNFNDNNNIKYNNNNNSNNNNNNNNKNNNANNNDNGDENNEDVGDEVDDYEPSAKKFKSFNPAVFKTGAKTLPEEKVESLDKQLEGKLRTKPGRGSRTLSLSCTDKLSRWSVVGLQGALLMYFLSEPLYLSGVVVCSPLYDEEAMKRGVYGRMETNNNNNNNNNNDNISNYDNNNNNEITIQYNKNDNNTNNINNKNNNKSNKNNNNLITIHKPLLNHINTNDFVHSKWFPCQDQLDPSPAAICWYDKGPKQQVLARGRLLGATKKSTSKPFVCQASLFKRFSLLKDLYQQKGFKLRHSTDGCETYRDYKEASLHYQTSFTLFKNNYFKHWPSKLKHYDFK